MDDVRAQKAVTAGVEVHRAHAMEPAGVARSNNLVPRSEVGFEDAPMGLCQTAQGSPSRGPAAFQGKPAIHHHVPHLLRFEVEHGELEKVVRQEAPAVKPASYADDAHALSFALLEPSPAGGTVDCKSVPWIADKAIGSEEQNARELFRRGCPPMEGHPSAEAVTDEGTVEWQSLRVTEVKERCMPSGRIQRTVMS